MPDEREAILRRGYEALNRGDLAAALADFDADVLVEDHEYSLASPSRQRGHQGFVNIFAAVNEGFDDVAYEPLEFTHVAGAIVVHAMRTGRGTASGVAVNEQQWHIFDFRDGQITRFRSFLARELAFEVLGVLPP